MKNGERPRFGAMREPLFLTARERDVAGLYGELHRHADASFARQHIVPRFVRHLRELGLDPETALRGKSFLDAGCGGFAGGAAAAIELGAREILGIDLSAANVRSARERFRHCPNVRFRRENLIRLSLESESWDFIYCVGVLMCLEQPLAAFRQLVRVLKPGGRIYIGVYGRGGLYNRLAVPAARLAGRIVPRRITASFLKRWLPAWLKPTTSLMDLMYVPIDRHYRVAEVRRWFEEAGMEATFLRHPEQPRTPRNRLLFGEGSMIYFSAVKPRAAGPAGGTEDLS